MFWKNCVPNVPMRLFPASGPVTHSGQLPGPVAPPATSPGCTGTAPRGPAYSFSMAATCGAVKQASDSAPLHNRPAGWNTQAVGSSTTPSSMPSFASHCASVAVSMAGDASEAGM